MVKCKQCGKEIDTLAVFPGGICLECHAEKVDKLLLQRPDFVGAINWSKRKPRARRLK